ncbi:MAG: MBL fold metallo-hydrolase [Pseudomonadota bacterium]
MIKTRNDLSRLSPRLIFLGVGAAWRTPEMGCPCEICREMRARGEKRTRTALWFEGDAKILIDCGPDIIDQLESCRVDRPDLILITHEHGDHYLGLDELEVFRRRGRAEDFNPIPTYAHPLAWPAIEARFGYLFGKLIEKKEAWPGVPFPGPTGSEITITPFKTDHGPFARGSQGYILRYPGKDGIRKLAYTSDFKDADPSSDLERPDVLVAQAHWFNEPKVNRPYHMSLQRLLDYLERWRPREMVFLVHISDGDLVEGEDPERFLKKQPPLAPLWDPERNSPFPVPRCREEWQQRAEGVFKARSLDIPVTVAWDGLVARV